jgi:hypothetical protein
MGMEKAFEGDARKPSIIGFAAPIKTLSPRQDPSYLSWRWT